MKRVNWPAAIAGGALMLIIILAGVYMARPGGFIDIPEPPKEAPVPADIVAVTPNGTKYHRDSCSSLRNSPEIKLMTPEEAAEAGYEPCLRCRP